MRYCATLSRKSAKDKWSIWAVVFIRSDRMETDIAPSSWRTLVKAYKGLSSTQVQQLLDEGDFLEICHDA
jgi:hypothetical protein